MLTASDVEVKGSTVSYVARLRNTVLGPVKLAVPGRHSVYNSLAAVAVGLELDVPFPTIARALGRFRGVDRRFQVKGRAQGAIVVDDYAHHPTEIQATLAAAREGFGLRTIAVFQPHRYTRTKALLEDFGRAFFLADRIVVCDVYAAGEAPIPGIDGAAVAAALVRHGHPSVVHASTLAEAGRLVREMVRPGDLVLTLGAGNVWQVAEDLVRSSAPKPRARRPRSKKP
jgi:UDP-N-acetylmuramate--alanine ligase